MRLCFAIDATQNGFLRFSGFSTMRQIIFVISALILSAAASAAQAADAPFDFGSIMSLSNMHDEMQKRFPLGTPRDELYGQLAKEGGAAHYVHPERDNVEKYVYAINLCRLHVFIWNISAHFFNDGKLTQIFVNGEPVYEEGDILFDPSVEYDDSIGAKVSLMSMSRPEASEGESAVSFVQLEPLDGDDSVDVLMSGAGPTRADPSNFGKLHVYRVMPRWHSIFTADTARAIVPYSGSCPD